MLGFPIATYPVGAGQTSASSGSGGGAGGDTGGSTGGSTGTGGTTGGATPPGTITVPASRTAVFAANARVVVFGTGSTTLNKAQADQLYYVGDVTKDLNDSATTIPSSQSVALIVSGVTVLEGPTVQGNLILVKLGGLDTSPGAANFCTFRVTCANGEVFDRTIHFTPVADTSHVIGKDPDDQRYYAADFSADAARSTSAVASVSTPTPVGVNALTVAAIQGNKVIVKLGGLDTSDGAINSLTLPVTLVSTEVIVRTIYFSRVDN